MNELIERQETLTAVEKFAFQHDLRQLPPGQSRYQELIPKQTPGAGQQYAFEVNLDQCTGCKACVMACHHENGLDEDETWRSVGLLHGGSSQEAVLQHVTSACHHCLDPACMNGCPVNAYEKEKETGIVKHWEDQCIGCQYCTFTCPYDVPKYNKKKGIVHKCDMCISRLNAGEAPACVRACPSEAIRITLIDTASVRKNPTEYVRLPEAPDSRYTLPTTRYLRKKEFPWNTTSMDFYSIQPEHSHTPLIVMLVLTQLSVGTFCAGIFLENHMAADMRSTFMPYHILIALGVGLLALAASIFHLGRPRYAFRAVLGLKKSWLSREIVAFGGFAFLSTIYALVHWLSPFVKDILVASTAVLGILAVLCSAMVYKVTRRPFWDHQGTIWKFFLTTGILGISSGLFLMMIFSGMSIEVMKSRFMPAFENLCLSLVVMTSVKLIIEAAIFCHMADYELTSLKKTALLMTGRFRRVMSLRFLCGVVGGMVLPAALLISRGGVSLFLVLMLIFVLSLTGEFLERYLFFRTVVPLKMSGAKMS